MGAMSGFEKFFVNRWAERNAEGLLGMVSKGGVTIPTGNRILELGAGRGALSLLLYQRFAPSKLVVTDYDPSQASLAGSYFKSKLGSVPENIEIKTADALSLPFRDESFDFVFASHVLHHVEKHEWNFENIPMALAEVHRVLSPDGLFVYEELFNKSRIRERLTSLGFEKVLDRRNWPGNRFCVYRKVGRRRSRKHDTGSPLHADAMNLRSQKWSSSHAWVSGMRLW